MAIDVGRLVAALLDHRDHNQAERLGCGVLREEVEGRDTGRGQLVHHDDQRAS